MGIAFDQSTQRYLADLRETRDIEHAISVANLSHHREQVYTAALTMLETEGSIDMKRLATAAGISRASLYRYYPDKLAVEAEVAAATARRMTEAAAPHEGLVKRLDAAMGVLIDFPAGAASLAPVVAVSDVSVISTSVEVIVGHIAATPVILGFAELVASAHRRGQLDEVHAMREAITKQFALSYSAASAG